NQADIGVAVVPDECLATAAVNNNFGDAGRTVFRVAALDNETITLVRTVQKGADVVNGQATEWTDEAGLQPVGLALLFVGQLHQGLRLQAVLTRPLAECLGPVLWLGGLPLACADGPRIFLGIGRRAEV